MRDIIFKAFADNSEYTDIISAYRSGKKPLLVTGLCEHSRAAFSGALAHSLNKKPFILVPDEKTANTLAASLSAFIDNVYVFPSRDLVYDYVESYSKEYEQERIGILSHILNGNYGAIIAVPDAAMEYTVPRSVLSVMALELKLGDTVSDFASKLVSMGYKRADVVEGVGQFSVRGSIFDVFSPSYLYPCRIDFFGDDVDSIGFFDPITQRSIERRKDVTLIPVSEFIADSEAKEKIIDEIDSLILKAKTDNARNALRKEREDIVERGDVKVPDRRFAHIYGKQECLLDYLRDNFTIVFETSKVKERARLFAWETRQNAEAYAREGIVKYKNAFPIMSNEEFIGLVGVDCISLDVFVSADDVFGYRDKFAVMTRQTMSFSRGFDLLCDDLSDYIAAGKNILILTASDREAQNLIEIIGERDITAYKFAGTLYPSLVAVGVSPVMCSLHGFETRNFVLITDEELRRGRTAKKSAASAPSKSVKKKSEKIASYADLTVGDYVVHTNHGIGVYAGLHTLKTEGVYQDYIKINYAGSDSLYVPCNQLDCVNKFIGAEGTVRVSRLGTAEWHKAKARAKKSAADVAKKLIALYSERMKHKAYAFLPDDSLQFEFESLFEYEETESQNEAIYDIKRDMERDVPMDRLLCGDVGFGKTEVALRAVFKCVNDGKQAAILVPTTILAWQHYQTMLSRFRSFPVNIEMISRFRTKKNQNQTIMDLKTGKIDVIVGTHRLLQKDIDFKDLGLLVVDEEQRFGVSHKEKLKEIARNVHVLTLSATPIPRTLNMAISGIRDMSVLEEAPADRVPVQTYVFEHDDGILYEAIRRELRRGGQVFYLHNTVDTTYAVAAKLQNEFPDATVAVAHGKMSREELAKIWENLVSGEIDILVCTTIIETGVDVPNANTLIIENADRMGISQLHQIRGRVGRSTRKAYAYLTYKSDVRLTEIATKRLEAIKAYTEFGSGFKIAMRDLELRGAGNLLGTEQSGHMETIGYDLYIKLLEEAVSEEKGEPKKEKTECSVSLSVNAYIPDDYIGSMQLRLDMYKKIAHLENEAEREDFEDELRDRFGDFPKCVESLIRISILRHRAEELGIVSLEQRSGVLCAFIGAAVPTEIFKAACALPEMKGYLMFAAGLKPHLSYRMKRDGDTLAVAEAVISALETLKKNKS